MTKDDEGYVKKADRRKVVKRESDSEWTVLETYQVTRSRHLLGGQISKEQILTW